MRVGGCIASILVLGLLAWSCKKSGTTKSDTTDPSPSAAAPPTNQATENRTDPPAPDEPTEVPATPPDAAAKAQGPTPAVPPGTEVPAVTARTALEFERLEDNADAMRVGPQGYIEVLIAFGSEYPAKSFCTEDTLFNPEDLTVLRIAGRSELAYLCPGSLDGVTNVLTVFADGQKPRSARVEPPSSSHILDEEQIEREVRKLLRKR